MVSLAVSTASRSTSPLRTTATAEWSSWVLPANASSWARAACASRGLSKRRGPSASVWSAPMTSRPGFSRAIAIAFSRASSVATFAGASGPAAASTARSSRSGTLTSIGRPAATSIARREALRDASTRECAVHQSGLIPLPADGGRQGAT
jgi:hypothetical protein